MVVQQKRIFFSVRKRSNMRIIELKIMKYSTNNESQLTNDVIELNVINFTIPIKVHIILECKKFVIAFIRAL